jgi:hypothetical protein
VLQVGIAGAHFKAGPRVHFHDPIAGRRQKSVPIETTFPKPLHYALVTAFSSFGLGLAAALITGTNAKELVMLLYLAGALSALFAVPGAVFLLLRNPSYVCRKNVVMTLLAAIPFLALLVVIAFLASGPRFHI